MVLAAAAEAIPVKPSEPADSAFWQRILAAEIAPERCRAFLRGLGNGPYQEADLLQAASQLSLGERENLLSADLAALEGALAQGAEIVLADDFWDPLDAATSVPPALFLWGRREGLGKPAIAIVGTRQPSIYGKACALKFAEAFAMAGACVVSGGAVGIDAAAHEGSMGGGGQTIAVLGTGIDQVYPASHRALFQRIRQNGCLISRFAAGTTPKGYRFPLRNHLIAAVSHAVVVVEAPEKSGSLITASSAGELGRQVFVVPANISNVNFRGSHALIRDGAILVDHPDQVLEALDIRPVASAGPGGELNPIQAKIVAALAVRPLSPDLIVDQTGLTSAEVLAELTVLEIEGRVLRDGVGYALRH